MNIKNVFSELAGAPEGTFLSLMPFNDNPIGACSITGHSPVWEMHPDTDECFFILDGELEITLLQGDRPERFVACTGSLFVVPQGIWHKPAAPTGAKFLYLTPGTTQHAEDPRVMLSTPEKLEQEESEKPSSEIPSVGNPSALQG